VFPERPPDNQQAGMRDRERQPDDEQRGVHQHAAADAEE
jgi:hypothetical protein